MGGFTILTGHPVIIPDDISGRGRTHGEVEGIRGLSDDHQIGFDAALLVEHEGVDAGSHWAVNLRRAEILQGLQSVASGHHNLDESFTRYDVSIEDNSMTSRVPASMLFM